MKKETKEPNIKSPDEAVIEEKVSMEETIPTPRPLENLPAEPKPKKRVGLAIMLVVLVLLLVGGALALGYLWGSNNQGQSQNSSSNPNSSSNNEETNSTPVQQEVELTDATLKKDVNQKVAYLNWVNNVADDATKVIEKMVRYNSPFEQIYTNSMDDDRKLETVFFSLSSNFTPVHVNITPEKYAVAKSLLEQDKYNVPASSDESIENVISQKVTTIDADTVAQRYYDLFGEELNPRSISAPAICSNIYYSQDTSSYLRFPFMCGGTSAGEDIILQEKITEQGDNVFVYYRASSAVLDFIANDFSFQEGRTAIDGISTSADLGNIKTNLVKDMESNPSKYAEYRLVFEKNDKGTYSFKRAEKVE